MIYPTKTGDWEARLRILWVRKKGKDMGQGTRKDMGKGMGSG